MRILVTGHKGYIGTVLAPMAMRAGHDIVGLDSDLYRNSSYGSAPAPADEIIKDIRDVEKADLEGIGAIIHLAGLSNDVLGDLNPELTYEINHAASVRLATMAKEVGIGRFVFASSCSNYGAAGDGLQDEDSVLQPVTSYAKSKVMVENDVAALADATFSPVFMRNATAYGVSPRMRFDLVLNNLVAWAHTTGKVLLKSDGSPWRPLVHVEDISRAAIAAVEAPQEVVHNRAFNIGATTENYRMIELAEIVRDTVSGSEIRFAESAAPDERTYRVDFHRYRQSFLAEAPVWTAREGARQILDYCKSCALRLDDHEGPRFNRIGQLTALLAAGELDESLRWRSPQATP